MLQLHKFLDFSPKVLRIHNINLDQAHAELARILPIFTVPLFPFSLSNLTALVLLLISAFVRFTHNAAATVQHTDPNALRYKTDAGTYHSFNRKLRRGRDLGRST